MTFDDKLIAIAKVVKRVEFEPPGGGERKWTMWLGGSSDEGCGYDGPTDVLTPLPNRRLDGAGCVSYHQLGHCCKLWMGHVVYGPTLPHVVEAVYDWLVLAGKVRADQLAEGAARG